MKLKTRFIVNPISGGGKQLKLIPLLDKYLDKSRFDYEIVQTNHPKHAKDLTTEAVNNNYDLVVAVGGDGSVNEVGRRLIHTHCALGIIPSGSGNGMARTLGIPLGWKRAIHRLNKAEVTTIDTGLINNEKFIGLAGIGFDGLIAHKFDKAATRGLKTYLRLITKHIPRFKTFGCSLKSAAGTFKGEAAVVVAANSQQWGNEAKIAPTASLTDGKMAFVILPKLPTWRIPSLAFEIMAGSLHRTNLAEVIHCEEAILNTDYTLAHVDGEPVEFTGEVKISCVPASLRVMV